MLFNINKKKGNEGQRDKSHSPELEGKNGYHSSLLNNALKFKLQKRTRREEFRTTEQSKINKQTRTKQDSLHNTPFIYKEGLSSNSIYSQYPSANIRVQVGFCFFPFLDMYLMINHLQMYQTLLILEQCGLNID